MFNFSNPVSNNTCPSFVCTPTVEPVCQQSERPVSVKVENLFKDLGNAFADLSAWTNRTATNFGEGAKKLYANTSDRVNSWSSIGDAIYNNAPNASELFSYGVIGVSFGGTVYFLSKAIAPANKGPVAQQTSAFELQTFSKDGQVAKVEQCRAVRLVPSSQPTKLQRAGYFTAALLCSLPAMYEAHKVFDNTVCAAPSYEGYSAPEFATPAA